MFVVKVPGTNSEEEGTAGCEIAGNRIIKELKNIHTNESGKIVDSELIDLEEIHLDNSNPDFTNKLIYKNALEIFGTKPKTIFLGGDQSISYSLCRAFLSHCRNENKNPCLIVFDAHLDCLPIVKAFPNNRQWLRGVIESGFPAKNIMLVGVRNSEIDELSFAKNKAIKMISIDSITEDLHEACDTIMEFSNGKELYASIDASVLDPAFAPSAGNPEQAGLSSRDFIYMIKRINKIKNLRAFDITEINEKKDKKYDDATIKLGAKILSELI